MDTTNKDIAIQIKNILSEKSLENLDEAWKILQKLNKEALSEKQIKMLDELNRLNGSFRLSEDYLISESKEEKDKIYNEISDKHMATMTDKVLELCDDIINDKE